MSVNNNVEMIFYAHPWSVHLLEEVGLGSNQQAILIEVATRSNLSVLCGGDKQARRGALPLLTHPAKVDLTQIARSYPLIPAPLVLAANPPLTRDTLIHSLLALDSRQHRCDVVRLLVHVSDALDYEALFPLVDRFRFLWDVADFPTRALVDCARALKDTESLGSDRWGGFHVGSHWLRQTPAAEDNRSAIAAIVESCAL